MALPDARQAERSDPWISGSLCTCRKWRVKGPASYQGRHAGRCTGMTASQFPALFQRCSTIMQVKISQEVIDPSTTICLLQPQSPRSGSNMVALYSWISSVRQKRAVIKPSILSFHF